MPLTVPSLDDRNYQQILTEALARIPAHTPEWTNFDDADPGVTLLQLFAFMTESIIYRANLIPDRVKRTFLKLLDIPMLPATPATGFVTFDNTKGPMKSEVLPAGTALNAGQIDFRTLYGVEVLPLEGRIYYKQTVSGTRRNQVKEQYDQLYASYASSVLEQLDYYETATLPLPTSGAELPFIDFATVQGHALWIALLVPKPADLSRVPSIIAQRVLTVGVLPGFEDTGKALTPATLSESESPALDFAMPVVELDADDNLPRDNDGRPVITFRTLNSRPTTDVLQKPGLIEVELPSATLIESWTEINERLDPLEHGVGKLPPALDDAQLEGRLLTWLRVRARVPQNGDTSGAETADETTQTKDDASKINLRVSWMGINASQVEQRIDVVSEDVGRGTGEPDQVVQVVNTPVVPDSLRLMVNNEVWLPIDDLNNAAPEIALQNAQTVPGTPQPVADRQLSKRYVLNPESGEIRFGNGIRGARPPRRAVIRASYSYTNGRAGNLGIGAISNGPALPAGTKVTNPVRTWGGSAAETLDSALDRLPAMVKTRERLVAKSDFKTIVRATPGVEIGRVEILPLLNPAIQDVNAQGAVTVMVIPRYDLLNPDAPQPDQLFIDTVCRYIEPRRLVTTEIFVRGPDYVDLWVSIGFDAMPGVATAEVRDKIVATIRRFLSPLNGSYDGSGWPLEKSVDPLELGAVVARVPGVAKVQPVLLTDSTGLSRTVVTLRNLELPRLRRVAVQSGLPMDLSDVQGTTDTTGGGPGDGTVGGVGDGVQIVPVPVVPAECE